MKEKVGQTLFFFLLQMTDRLILLCQTGQAQLNIADEIASMHWTQAFL